MLWECRSRLCFRFNLPLVAAATAHHLNWFYPALMIALGKHYFPFIFSYGMPEFGVLAALLIGAGLTIGLYMQSVFSLGALADSGGSAAFCLHRAKCRTTGE